MFEDVGDSGGVAGGGAEGDAEYFVVVVGAYREEFGAGFFVAVEGAVGAVFGDDVAGDDVVGGVRCEVGGGEFIGDVEGCGG